MVSLAKTPRSIEESRQLAAHNARLRSNNLTALAVEFWFQGRRAEAARFEAHKARVLAY